MAFNPRTTDHESWVEW